MRRPHVQRARPRPLAGPCSPALLLLLSGLLATEPVAAQGIATAGLRGSVHDSLGAHLAAVAVAVRHEGTGARFVTATDAGGRYRLVGLAPGGPYTVTFSRMGYRGAQRSDIVLHGGANLRLDVVLVAHATELSPVRVDVEREPVIDASRTGAATLLGERVVNATPLITHNASELAALAPLVTLDERTISIAGQSHRFNSVRIDGALSQDLFGLSPSGVPGGGAYAKPLPLDAIQQYQILVAPFDVRQSGFTGGVLNAVTRSGTNSWEVAATGFYRDAVFGGTADDIDAASARTGDFASRLVALSTSGPVLRDRTHVFAAAELEWRRRPVPGFSVGSADALRTGLAADSLMRLVRILADTFAVSAGEAGRYALDNPLGNVFLRVDHRFGDDHRMVARYNFVSARNDAAPNRASTGAYELSSNAHRLRSRSHGASVQLVSRLGAAMTLEALVNVQRIRDRVLPNATFPEIDVLVRSAIAGGELRRHVRAGAAASAQRNELDQDLEQLTLAVSRGAGRHLLTAGIDVERSGIRHLFVPSAAGTWRFDTLASVAANRPVSYERTIAAPGFTGDPAVRFHLLQTGAFVQDEWTPFDRLTLTFGVRADRPIMPRDPDTNETVDSAFAAYSAALPDGRVLLAPRFGFNWRRGDTGSTQLRGGVGVFTGRPPLNTIASAYAHTGERTALLVCTGSAAPAFAARAEAPFECVDGSAPLRRQVVFFDPQLRWPQDWRGSLALDQELPGDFVLSLEGVYTRAVHQLEMRDLNLREVADPASHTGYTAGYGERPVFGIPVLPSAFAAERVLPGYSQVLQITNGERNSAFGASVELQRAFSDRLDLRVAYSYNGSYDTRSLGFPDAQLNFGATALRGHPNVPELTYSDYHRPHKLLASLWSRVSMLGTGTEVTLVYQGQSGRPYSYVYASDANADGFPGPGALADTYNDLVYVPLRLSDDIPAPLASTLSWLGLVELDPCLQAWRGRVLGRNVCSAPWSHRVDMRLTQGVRVRGARVRVIAEVMNLLNLLDDEWGLVHDVVPRVPVLAFSHREELPVGIPGEQVAYYAGPLARDAATGHIAPALPYTPAYPESHWRAQLGFRFDF